MTTASAFCIPAIGISYNSRRYTFLVNLIQKRNHIEIRLCPYILWLRTVGPSQAWQLLVDVTVKSHGRDQYICCQVCTDWTSHLQMEDLSSVESVKSKDQPGVSLDNESGYEDGLSDGNEVSIPHTPDLSLTENIDSLIADTSVLTLQTDTDNSLNTRY